MQIKSFRTCIKCKQEKTINNFIIKGGYHHRICTDCDYEAIRLKEKGHKICTKCKEEKQFHKFAISFHKKYNKSYYHSACKACEAKAYRSTEHGKTSIARRKKKTVQKYRAGLIELKKKLMSAIGQEKCIKCGFSNHAALCFHHREPTKKEYTVTWGLSHYYPFNTLILEVIKCDVYCINCHTIFHKKESKWSTLAAKFKQLLMLCLNQKGCTNCNCTDFRCLCFHHRDPKEKLFKIAEAVLSKWTLNQTLDEIKKCDILCMNCHSIFHAEEDRKIYEEVLNDSKNF